MHILYFNIFIITVIIASAYLGKYLSRFLMPPDYTYRDMYLWYYFIVTNPQSHLLNKDGE